MLVGDYLGRCVQVFLIGFKKYGNIYETKSLRKLEISN